MSSSPPQPPDSTNSTTAAQATTATISSNSGAAVSEEHLLLSHYGVPEELVESYAEHGVQRLFPWQVREVTRLKPNFNRFLFNLQWLTAFVVAVIATSLH
jgi:hypothetical protein